MPAAILTRRARIELREAVRRIGSENLVAARGFNDAIEDAAVRIGANPSIGAHRPGLAGSRYRFWPIRRYRYLLVDTDATDPPRIVRIIHTARDLPSLLTDLRD
jgi:toxin ParE1/3/4